MKRILFLLFAWITASTAFASAQVESPAVFLTSNQYKAIINGLFNPANKKNISHDFADGSAIINGKYATLIYSSLEVFTISYQVDGTTSTLCSRDEDGFTSPSETLDAHQTTNGMIFDVNNISSSADPKSTANSLGNDDFVKQSKLSLPKDSEITIFITDKDGNKTFGKQFSNSNGSFIGFDVDGDGSFDAVINIGANPAQPITNCGSNEVVSLIDANHGDGFNKALAYTSFMVAQIFNSDSEFIPWVRFYTLAGEEIQGFDEFVECKLLPNNYYSYAFSAIYSPVYTEGWSAHILMIPAGETPDSYQSAQETISAIEFNTPDLSVIGNAYDLGRRQVSPFQRSFAIEQAPFELTPDIMVNESSYAYGPEDIYDAIMSSGIKHNGNFAGISSDGCDTQNRMFSNILAEGDPLNYANETERPLPIELSLNIAVADPEVPMSIDIAEIGIDNLYTKCDSYTAYEVVMPTSAELFLPDLPVAVPSAESAPVLIDNPAFVESDPSVGAAQAIAYQANISANISINDFPFADNLYESPKARIYDDKHILIAEVNTSSDGSFFNINEDFFFDGKAQDFSIELVWTIRDDNGVSHSFSSNEVSVSIPETYFEADGFIKLQEQNYDESIQAGIINNDDISHSLDFFSWGDYSFNSAIQSSLISVHDNDNDDSAIHINNYSSNSYNSYIADEKFCDFSGFTVNLSTSGIRHFSYVVIPEYAVFSPTTPVSASGSLKADDVIIIQSSTPLSADATFVPDTLTDIDSINSDAVNVAVLGSDIIVSGNQCFSIFNASGALIYSGNDSSVSVNSGLYFVKVGKSSFKVFVK